jgi:hypothetical protein
MKQFNEGQEVEVEVEVGVHHSDREMGWKEWRKAKIVGEAGKYGTPALPEKDKLFYVVELHDGRRVMFDAEHIRIDTPRGQAAIHPMETLR